MARKPLIVPGSILPESDTFNRILLRDREKAGRGTPEEELAPHEESNMRSNITSNMTAQKSDGASESETPPLSGQTAQERIAFMRRSRLVPMTLRIPEELNDWLDEYAHAHRKEGVKKQDVIARAVELLFLEVAAGEGLP